MSLSRHKQKKYKDNLRERFLMATAEEYYEGIMWYYDANKICEVLGEKYMVDSKVVATVLSILSPRNKWEQNVKDTDRLLAAWRNAIHPEDIRVCTFHRNKIKAWRFLQGQVEMAETSLKTYSFIKNVSDLDDRYVTVDIWHHRAVKNKKIGSNVGITFKVYQQIANITKELGEEFGLKGFEIQAIIWAVMKRTYN